MGAEIIDGKAFAAELRGRVGQLAAAFEATAVPAGLRPVAVAVLFTAPASTSAWVIV